MKAILLTAGMMMICGSVSAAVCADGIYRAACAGPNGAAVVRKPPVATPYHPQVNCANGVYRAGCAGQNGAAVVRKSPY